MSLLSAFSEILMTRKLFFFFLLGFSLEKEIVCRLRRQGKIIVAK